MANKNTAGKNKIVAILVLVLPAFLLVFISTRGCEHKFKELPDYGKAISYSFEDVNGKVYHASDFKDQVVLINTLQITCPDSCAISLWHLDQLVYQHIRKNKTKKLKQIKLISFVTDNNGKPIKDLAKIQKALEDNIVEFDPSIWILAKGNAEQIYDFKYNQQSLLEEGEKYYGGKAFLELMLLLDKQNHLRMVGRGKTEGEIRRMFQHVALLMKQYDKERKQLEK
jgi:cytochrome oxidase Cu insertion factor (SCO1/SenC/PrrC family)